MEQLWTVQCLSAWLLDAILGTKEVWGHKDSVLCLQITLPALGVAMRDLIAAFTSIPLWLWDFIIVTLSLVFPHSLNPTVYF